MADKVDVTFRMTAEDLSFLAWAMEFLKGGPHDFEDLCGYWRVHFERALEEHFEPAEEEAEEQD